MSMRNGIALIIGAMTTFLASADIVYLKSGSLLKGECGKLQDSVLEFKSEDVGTVKIKIDKILKIDSSCKHVVQYKDMSTKELPVTVKDGKLVVDGKELDTTQIKATDPVVETWHGSIMGSFLAARGNTTENTWGLLANLKRKYEIDRLNFDFGYHYSETGKADGERQKTTDRWEIEGKHDHFWYPKIYNYENLKYERDKIAELLARYRVGLGGGYQWLDGFAQEHTGKWNFNQEIGVNWIKEEYENNDDQKNGGFAALRYGHHLGFLPKFNDKTEFFHDAEYLPEVDDWDKFLVKANVGFSTKIYMDLAFTAKIEWDYNSKPANDRKRSDVRYILGLGYSW